MFKMTRGPFCCAVIVLAGCTKAEPVACDSGVAGAAADYPEWQSPGDCELCSDEPCLDLQSTVAEFYPYPDISGIPACDALLSAGDALVHEGAKALTAKLQLAIDQSTTGQITSVDPDDICQQLGDASPAPPPPPLPTGDCPEFDPDISGTSLGAANLAIDASGACPLLVDNNFFSFSNDPDLSKPMNLIQSGTADDVCGCWLRTDVKPSVNADIMWWSVIYSMANFKTATILSAGFCEGAQEQTITVYEMKVAIAPTNLAGKVTHMLDDPNTVTPPAGVTILPKHVKFAQGDLSYAFSVSCSGSTCTGTWDDGVAPAWVDSTCTSWWDLDGVTSPTQTWLIQNEGRPVGVIDPAVELHLSEPELIYDAVEARNLTLVLAPQAN